MLENWDDSELIEQIKNSNHFAFRRFFDEYKDKVYNFALKFVLTKNNADEITQIVFIKFWEKRHLIRSDSSLDSFLYVLTKNSCFDFLKKVAHSRELSKNLANMYELKKNYTENSLFYNDLWANAEKVINQLPAKQKQVYMLAKIDKKSYDEIAELMKISKNTVKTQLRLANSFVRETLSKNYGIFLSFLWGICMILQIVRH